VVLDSHGSDTSLVKDNLITRGDVAPAGPAIDVHGRSKLISNRILGFEKPPPPVKQEKSR
jgi:hypothetical protein